MLNIFNDHDYNRSVITIVAAIDSISERTAVFVHLCPKCCRTLISCGSPREERRQLLAAALGIQSLFPALQSSERGRNPLISFVTDLNTLQKKKSGQTFFLAEIRVKSYISFTASS